MSKKLKFHSNLTGITSTLHEDVFTFMTLSSWNQLRTRNVSNKGCRENQNTHFMFNNFFPKIATVYKLMSKNMVKSDRPQVTIWRRVAYRISKATRPRPCIYTHTHALTHLPTCVRTHTKISNNYCFLRQQLFREGASMLRDTYIACVV
jgi:hypothetical protein